MKATQIIALVCALIAVLSTAIGEAIMRKTHKANLSEKAMDGLMMLNTLRFTAVLTAVACIGI